MLESNDITSINIHSECSICLENIESYDILVTLCKHEFHSSCLIEYITKNNINTPKCPLCKSNLIKDRILLNEENSNTNTLTENIIDTARRYNVIPIQILHIRILLFLAVIGSCVWILLTQKN